MIKKYAILSILFGLGTTAAVAQFTTIHTFNDTAGANPLGALTLSGKTLYGTAAGGGANNFGCIFSMDTTGANYKDIYDFTGASGANPQGGTLKLSGTKLFGTTFSGGANDSGCVFSVNTDGTGYKILLNFAGPNGAAPYGSVILIGTKLFGLTFTGGVNIMGNIYTVDTAGNNYKDLMDFTGGNGSNPYGDFTYINHKLYSMTGGGGLNGYGNIFSIDTNGANYTDLFDFDGTNGAYPNNLLVPSGTQFFGVTNSGGGPEFGNVFSIDTNGSTFYKDLVDFAGTSSPEGQYPLGDVILSGHVLYGLTGSGGAVDSGCIYSVDTTGNNYTDLYDFSGPDGSFAASNVTISGKMMYGTTAGGGADFSGTIFSFNSALVGINTLKNNASVKLYPNPSGGQFTFSITNYVPGTMNVEVFNELGENVYSQSVIRNSQFVIDLSSKSDGVYFYRVLNNDGSLISKGKLVIQK